MASIPVALFAYSRPDHLREALGCLRENGVPLVYAFSDGPGSPDKAPAVARVREMLREIDWCEVVLCERDTNLGLGRSILTGVSAVLREHQAAIVVEDDLVCVQGTYQYLCAALGAYRDDRRVMSVTGWTHPLVTPSDVTDQPYFDGRAESLIWGTWTRSWQGMHEDAQTLMRKCQAEGIDIKRYGDDLPGMAEVELQMNIWAVRFLYWHMLNHGLCLRPPWSMVEHIGFDAQGTNTKAESWIKNPPLKSSPPIPVEWPEPVENPACSRLHQAVSVSASRPAGSSRTYCLARRLASRALHALSLK